MFVYIGELCRYLVNQPEQRGERTPVKLAFGNGLRGDVWEKMEQRFRIAQVLEFYGSTEGNVSHASTSTARSGAVGRVPEISEASASTCGWSRFDVETGEPMRDGRAACCIECRPGEVGEAIGEIADRRPRQLHRLRRQGRHREEDAARRLRARRRLVPHRRPDAAGREGYFYFVDRIGDTFRWKGENVSTGEVAERLSARSPACWRPTSTASRCRAPRAGPAWPPWSPDEGFDLRRCRRGSMRDLPAYARPLFLRLRPRDRDHRHLQVQQDRPGRSTASTPPSPTIRSISASRAATTRRSMPELFATLNAGEIKL